MCFFSSLFFLALSSFLLCFFFLSFFFLFLLLSLPSSFFSFPLPFLSFLTKIFDSFSLPLPPLPLPPPFFPLSFFFFFFFFRKRDCGGRLLSLNQRLVITHPREEEQRFVPKELREGLKGKKRRTEGNC